MVDLIPSWSEISAAYPYAPGRGELTNEQWQTLRERSAERRQTQRKNQTKIRKAEKETKKAMQAYEKAWQEAEEDMASDYILDRDELPGRNLEILREGMQNKNATISGLVDYLKAAYDAPQNIPEGILSWAGHTGEEAGKYILSLFGVDEEEPESVSMRPWLERYIASGGGNGTGVGAGVNPSQLGSAFPDIRPINVNYGAGLDNIKAPRYQEREFDPIAAIAQGLANTNWLTGDTSKAVAAFNSYGENKRKNKTDTANANAEAEFELEKWKAVQQAAREELKANLAFKNAQLAISRWQANQPRALGGNQMYWRDSNGNLHFQQVDKQGEARTVGNNAAMIEMMDLSQDQMKKMTPKKILQRANQAAMLYPDKDKIPFIQGYIMQATSMLPQGD